MSTKQTVPTVVVQDYEYGTDGQPLVNTEVTVRLAVSQALVSAGITGGAAVNIEPIEARVKTDANGFWSIPNIVRNSDITPSGTVYTVKVGLIRQYLIQVPAGAGPFTASAILVGTLPFFPQGSSVTGPITISGNLTVTGAGNFQGALTASAGLTVLGGGNVSGGWTVGGLLTMTDAASRLVPGATSFSIRDNANANDNLIVTNAGNVTVRGNLTVTGGPLVVSAGGATISAGDLSVTVGRLVLGAATSKIVPGATSLSLRNTADSADNFLLTDAGLAALRNALSIPPSAGGSLAPTSYGSVLVKIAETVLGSPAATVTFSSIPSGFRHLLLVYDCATNAVATNAALNGTFNGDTGANYSQLQYGLVSGGTSPGGGTANAQTTMFLGLISGTSRAAGSMGSGVLVIPDYSNSGFGKGVTGYCIEGDKGGATLHSAGGRWTPAVAAAVGSMGLSPGSGSFIASSVFTLYGVP